MCLFANSVQIYMAWNAFPFSINTCAPFFVVREVISSDYRIWNSHGDVLGLPNIDDFSETS